MPHAFNRASVQPGDMKGWCSHGEEDDLKQSQTLSQSSLPPKRPRATIVWHGFQPYPQEWWHFTLKGEPYPETYFNFPVR